MQLTLDVLKKLPKTDLHCHFDGSLRLSTIIEIAKRRGVKLFSYDHDVLMAHMKYGQSHDSLEEYLDGFEPPISVLQDAEDIERNFYEVCEDAARENVWHLELRYCPLLCTRKGLHLDDVVAACARAGAKAEKDFKMSVRQILCGLKHMPQMVTVAKLAAKFFDKGVAGIDMAGPEAGYPIGDHIEGLKIAKLNHLFITLHAGEASGPQNIADALHEGYAHRIGHGTSLIHDEAVLNYVLDHRIGIESCPISNVQTRSVRSLAEHPLPTFLKRGVRVSLNTDNRLVSNTTITRELATIIEAFDLNTDDIRLLLRNGFKSAFLHYEQKNTLIKAFDAAWAKMTSA